MNSKKFVELFYKEKNDLIRAYFDKSGETEVGANINDLGLTLGQMEKMQCILDTVITDTMYTILLGLDGEASIGDVQQIYRLYDEEGNELTDCGEISQYAYEYFQEEI